VVGGLVLVLLPAVGLAQAPPGSVELGVGTGRFIGGTLAKGSNQAFDRKVDVDQEPTLGFWLGTQLTPKWGVEVAYRRTGTHVIEYHGGLSASQQTLAGFVLATVEALAVRSFRRGNFVPYVGAGVGLANLDIDTPDRSLRDATRGGVSLTGGARFYLTRRFGIRIDVRGRATYLGVRGQGQDHGWLDSGRWFADSEITGGLFASFGGT
jgi:opacity protein-like surface antigen